MMKEPILNRCGMTAVAVSAAAVMVLCAASAFPSAAATEEDLARARPETWFHLIGGNVSKAGIVADLDAICAAGLGGIQLFHGGWSKEVLWPGVTNPIPCLSEQWEDLIGFTARECARRGLSFKMQNCPGWSMSGGPWISSDKAMRKLVAFERENPPKWEADDDFHEIATLTFPVERRVMVRFPSPQAIDHGWAYEPDADLIVLDGSREVFRRKCPQGAWHDPTGMTFDGGSVESVGLDRLQAISRSRHYVDRKIKVSFSTERKLDNWEAKAGWCLRGFEMSRDSRPVRVDLSKTLVIGHVNAKRRNHPAPACATGWECDKLATAGVEANFDGYLGRLLKGSLSGGLLKGMLVDSWECGIQNWTWNMEAEFKRLNGYELRPWLPAVFGYVLGSEFETERFLLDWRNTCSRLVEENYFATMARLAHENGMTVQFETAFGDVLPGDLLRFWKYADEPMCEFWSPFNNARGFVYSHDFKPVRPCVSSAHVYGKRRVSAEAFTSFSLTFDENMQTLKEDANRHFARGVTHLVFHTFTHNPIVGGLPPGSSFGAKIGTPFTRLQTWWPYLRDFTRYLTICGAELERGKPVVDILWYLGDAVGHKPSEREDLFGNCYKYDYLNRDALMTRVSVKDGRFVFPDGMSYRVLWVPAGTFLTEESAAKLADLERQGGRIVRGELKPDWEPDLVAQGGKLLWYHRRDDGEDIYFVAAPHEGFIGEVKVRDLPGRFCLNLAGGETRFLRPGFREPVRACRETRMLDQWSIPLGAWKDLPGSAEERSFSGTRAYVTKVVKPQGKGKVELDLGRVCHWASVLVNGQEVARLWCQPYRCDISEALREGENEICVRVTSTWYNRLVYDAGLPEKDRQTWTIAGPAADAPLRESGLIGPVCLIVE